jgi:formate dehydrogenase iron-sulfur subunit
MSSTLAVTPERERRPGTGAPAGAPARDRRDLDGGDLSQLSPVDLYLHQQHQLTAVERFSRHHDADLVPAQARYYRDLIPLAAPKAGEQYGFEVDLDSCSGCKACVTACHNLNGLDDDESFRSVGALFATAIEPWQQTVTTACHHCVDPACLNGCPVDAYDKDPITGIVKHLDDQCIGCSYCTLTCPYEVPRYNPKLGIVRKCDMCSDRLAVGEAPACVQACPTSAISITVVDVAELVESLSADPAGAAVADPALVPSAPSSRLTLPTTRYRSNRPLPADALPADHYSVHRSPAHLPLAVMLVLTQLSVGAFVLGWLLDGWAAPEPALVLRPYAAGSALVVGLVALAASTLHLGRPLYAWRAVIGLRHSWLSREIVAFGVFAGLAASYAAVVVIDAAAGPVRILGALVCVSGLFGVGCSVMIYGVTRRRWWRIWPTAPKFAASAVLTGSAAVILATVVAAAINDGIVGTERGPVFDAALSALVRPLVLVMIATAVVKLVLEASVLVHLRRGDSTDLHRTALLLSGDLHVVTVWRAAGGIIGGIVMPLVLLADAASSRPSVPGAIVVAGAALAASVGGELCERWQFFTASTSPRMPGVQE